MAISHSSIPPSGQRHFILSLDFLFLIPQIDIIHSSNLIKAANNSNLPEGDFKKKLTSHLQAIGKHRCPYATLPGCVDGNDARSKIVKMKSTHTRWLQGLQSTQAALQYDNAMSDNPVVHSVEDERAGKEEERKKCVCTTKPQKMQPTPTVEGLPVNAATSQAVHVEIVTTAGEGETACATNGSVHSVESSHNTNVVQASITDDQQDLTVDESIHALDGCFDDEGFIIV